jgi:hypothetical protein
MVFGLLMGGSLLGEIMTDIMPSDTQKRAIEAAEEWKPVVGYPEYVVSDHGRVRRAAKRKGGSLGHVLSPGSKAGGHRYVYLVAEGEKPKKQYIHRLVAAAFIGPAPFDGALVLHQDDDCIHNRPENLYWGTREQNVRDAQFNRKRHSDVRPQGAQFGEENSSAVLSESDVIKIRHYISLGMCGACIAKIYGVKKESIYNIAKGRTWVDVKERAL